MDGKGKKEVAEIIRFEFTSPPPEPHRKKKRNVPYPVVIIVLVVVILCLQWARSRRVVPVPAQYIASGANDPSYIPDGFALKESSIKVEKVLQYENSAGELIIIRYADRRDIGVISISSAYGDPDTILLNNKISVDYYNPTPAMPYHKIHWVTKYIIYDLSVSGSVPKKEVIKIAESIME